MEENKNLTVIEVRISYLRKLKGISQAELARTLGVSRSIITTWEHGYCDISLNHLVHLSYYYRVPVDYILGLISDFDPKDYHFQKELDLKYLGKQIRLIRKMEGFNQIEFSKKIHTYKSNLSYYEMGKGTISTANLKEICNTFGYSADWCIGNTDEFIRRKKNIQLKPEEFEKYISL